MPDNEKQTATSNRRSRESTDRISALKIAYERQEGAPQNSLHCYTAGADDILFSPHRWGGFPPIFSYLDSFADSLVNCAETVNLPRDFWREPLVIRRAIFLREVLLQKLPVVVEPGELLIGAPCPVALSKTLKPAERARFAEIEQQWQRQASKLIGYGIGSAAIFPGHYCPDFARVLSKGLAGLRTEIEEVRLNPKNRAQADLAEAQAICIDAAVGLARRYADEAERQSACQSGPLKTELAELAQICRSVPEMPATGLHQALQAIWFVRLLVTIAESGPGYGFSFGRLDRYLYPFYQADISAGRLTRERAAELIRMFLFRLDAGGGYPLDGNRKSSIALGLPCSITIGGSGPDGIDQTNDLTLIIIDAAAGLNLSQPDICLRVHDETPGRLLKRTAEITGAGGSPIGFCYENAIAPLIVHSGPVDDVHDFVAIGGPSWAIPGKTISGAGDLSINLLKILELTVNNGHDIATGKALGPPGGFADRFDDFDSLFSAFALQLKTQLAQLIATRDMADLLRSVYEPVPLLSLLFEGCLARGRDLYNGGADRQLAVVNVIGFWSAVLSIYRLQQNLFGNRQTTDLDEQVDGPFALAARVNKLLCNLSQAKNMAGGKNIVVGYFDSIHHSAFSPLTTLRVAETENDTTLSSCLNFPAEHRPPAPEILADKMSGIELSAADGGAELVLQIESATDQEKDILNDRLVDLIRRFGKSGITCLRFNVFDTPTADRPPIEKEPEGIKFRALGCRVALQHLPRRVADGLLAQWSSFPGADETTGEESTSVYRESRLPFAESDFYPRGYLAMTDERGRPAIAPLYYIARIDDAAWAFADIYLGEIRRYFQPDKAATILVDQNGQTNIYYGRLATPLSTGKIFDTFSRAEPFLSGSLTGLPGVLVFNVEGTGSIRRPSLISALTNRAAVDFACGFFGEGHNIFPERLDRLVHRLKTEVVLAYKDRDNERGGVSLAFVPALAPASGSVAVYLKRFLEPKIEPLSALALAVSDSGRISYQIKGSALTAKTFLGSKIGLVEVERIYCTCPPLTGRRIR